MQGTKASSRCPCVNVNVYCPSTVGALICLTEWGSMAECIQAVPLSASISGLWPLSGDLHEHLSKTILLGSCLSGLAVRSSN